MKWCLAYHRAPPHCSNLPLHPAGPSRLRRHHRPSKHLLANLRLRCLQATLASLCAQARQVAPSADPQGLCNIAWALGRMGHRDRALMEGVAQAALGKLDAFSLQELALLASGFGGGWVGAGAAGRQAVLGLCLLAAVAGDW